MWLRREIVLPIPPKTDRCWQNLLTGSAAPTLSLYAIRSLAARPRPAVTQDPNILVPAIEECTQFSTANVFLKRDTTAI